MEHAAIVERERTEKKSSEGSRTERETGNRLGGKVNRKLDK